MKRSIRIHLILPIIFSLASCGGDSAIDTGGDGLIATLELETSYPVPFSYLSGVRELSDGTIFAADPMSQVLLRLDLEAGTADTIGRSGAGPQEYQGPDGVFPLPGDSTLLVDLGNGRLTVVDPEGSFVTWTPMTTSTEDGDTRTVHPSFVDDAGYIYTTAAHFLPSPPDSLAIHKIDLASGEETPVASTWRTERVSRPRGAPRLMLSLRDAWAVGSDGRVAVVRANGYSVDWFFPDGTTIHGPPNAADRFPIGPDEIDAELENMATNGTFSSVLVGAGGTQEIQMTRGIPASYFENREGFEWPEMLPIIRLGETFVSPRGEVWVTRMMPAGEPGRVDIFDERGIRLGFVELSSQARIIGFTGGDDAGAMAYVTRTDDVGLIWLERYRIVWAEDRR